MFLKSYDRKRLQSSKLRWPAGRPSSSPENKKGAGSPRPRNVTNSGAYHSNRAPRRIWRGVWYEVGLPPVAGRIGKPKFGFGEVNAFSVEVS